jgi:hypothetical protein
MNQLIIGASVAIISAIIGALIGPMVRIIYDKRREKQRVQSQGLKNHFKQLETSVIKPISEMLGQITDSEGTLWQSTEGSFRNPKYYWPTKDFKEGEFANFKLHFPSQADIAARLMNEIDKHNEGHKSFLDNLTETVKEKTRIPIKYIIKSTGIAGERPFIYAEVPTYVQQTLYHLAVRKLGGNEKVTIHYYHDFRKARIERKKDDAWWVSTETADAVYAQVITEEEANLCKQTLVELMESSQLLDEMCEIYVEAERLENDSKSLASMLDFICQQYDKYGKLLRRERGCPICQVIFE